MVAGRTPPLFYSENGGDVPSAGINRYIYVATNRLFADDYLVKHAETERVFDRGGRCCRGTAGRQDRSPLGQLGGHESSSKRAIAELHMVSLGTTVLAEIISAVAAELLVVGPECCSKAPAEDGLGGEE